MIRKLLKNKRTTLPVLVLAALAGCDHDSATSSGSGGAALGTPSAGAPSDYSHIAGTYRGDATATAKASSTGVSIQRTRTEAVEIIIDAAGNVVLNASGKTFSGQLVNDTLSVSNQPVVIQQEDGDRCDGLVNYTARVEGDAINGSMTGSGECTYKGAAYDVSIEGGLRARRS